ncbi:acetolactate synthase [Lacticaseibacillus rhamnosus]|uniref:acetolactate synthase n=1 Tax=Lacticaseibacillus rhamnosus TaxID=47715 RepID=UPI0022EBB941|nr:acetolactate synthase [Lacticaseibacillus rhamnosus]MDA3727734.1 acetolactate synthase [Lacticaseibacillus rhamnosus]MDA3738662.1 acetolactate synthase [Lacticaseibacillus rhamnosus]MDA3743985.1 acetolactate synthase [Lacticaseibacillus rhamnosus]MDA3746654.1 acetolactate synthase [Lacticaseibacillus rhamnosus]MDA3752109.1 acetolactate synthase [Lacticaseibacillus rhamnosus]
MAEEKRYGADLIVESLANHGIDYVFGIPGAKIDRVFETLEHPKTKKSPQLIVARHEQNAAFMAAGIGRLTGKPGVVLTTSGPGASNLATGLVTATAEGDPVLALSGQVKRADLLRSSHQSMRNADLFAPITKYAAEVQDPDNVSEIIANAYQAAESGKQGASFVSIPQDVTDSPVNSEPIKPLVAPKLGPASPSDMTYLARAIKEASLPVLLLGMRASSSDVTAEIDHNFQPETELIGDISQTLDILVPLLRGYQVAPESKHYLSELQSKLQDSDVPPALTDQKLIHPLSIVAALQERVADDMTVAVDVGSHYIWMARHFRSYEPRHLLFSNGMQTLGVALPWAIAATLVRPGKKAVSISGDGGFLFSGQELETAVRLKADLVHIIWNDGHYDMVKFQEEMKYGRAAGVDFGPVDFVKYAEAFGAKGLRVDKPNELGTVLDEAFATQGPVIVDIPVDYSDNAELGAAMLPDQIY